MATFGFGQGVRRSEDPRLLTGQGRFTDDIRLDGQAHAVFVRSPFAHAAITGIDTGDAATAPGVLAVVTGTDLAAEGLGPIPSLAKVDNRDGSPMATPPRPALSTTRVRHVGEPVAVVVAETLDQARDAAELVMVDYDPLDAVTDAAAALAPNAPQLWPEAPANQAFDWDEGDAAAADRLFAQAAHVVALDLVNNRLVPTPLETRACLATYDPASARFGLTLPSQGVHMLKRQLAQRIFHVDPEQFHIRTPDVGGGFGMKIFCYPEYVVCLSAARRLGRPVGWTSDRTEAFVSDDHGRDHRTRAEMALDADGRIRAIRIDTIANLGAYLSNFAAFIPTGAGSQMYGGLYRPEIVYYRCRGAFTNTQPVDAYRGAGRPEAAYVVERLADLAARRLGLDPAEFRRRNFVPPSAMPYAAATGLIYDSGEFERHLNDALERSDYKTFLERRATARTQGRLRGFGIASYVEACAGGGPERTHLSVDAEGRLTLLIGTQTNGQGHQTAYGQIIAEHLGVAPEDITLVQGDSDRIATGGGTGGSRSVPTGGAAVAEAALKVQEKARLVAADLLEAAAADIVFADGRFGIVGTDRTATFAEITRHAAAADGTDTPFAEDGAYKPATFTFPNGTHACEVEIDPETGATAIVRYTVVDDFGRVLNPLLVAGQVHGGVVQGVGQALLEHTVFEADSGQLTSGSLMDYALPRADGMPWIDFSTIEVPCTTNPLGIKGAGEAGAIGACPAVINAVVDALAEFGVEHVDMPATPEVVWRLIHGRTAGKAA